MIAIQIDGGSTRAVEEQDSLQLMAWAITAGKDTVADAPIIWHLIDADTESTSVGFTLDSVTGLVVAESPGRGRVRPQLEHLTPREPITITVSAAPDSITPAGAQRLTVAPGDEASPALQTAVYDVTTYTDSVVPLGGKPVQFVVTYPQPGTADAEGFFLVPTSQDTSPPGEAHSLTVETGIDGNAIAIVRKNGIGDLPDSAIVQAYASTAVGGTVTGSPVRFVILFESN